MDTTAILSGAITILTFALAYYQFKKFSFWRSRGFGGPKPWPFSGTNIYYILRNKITVDSEWFRKYGKTYGIYENFKPTLRTSDNELITHVLVKNFSSFTDRDKDNVYGVVKRWLFFSEGGHWANQRALITPLFTSSRMRAMSSVIVDCVDRLMREFDSRLKLAPVSNGDQSKTAEESSPTFSKDELMSMGLDVIAQSFFSLKLDTYRDKTSQFYQRAFAWAKFDVTHFILWLCLPPKLKSYFEINIFPASKYEYFDKLSQSMINERRKFYHGSDKKKNDILQALIDARIPDEHVKVFDEEDDADSHYNDKINHTELERIHESQTKTVKFRKFIDQEIRAHMIFFFLAGFESTGSTISICLYTLSHNQDDQQLVYEEIKSRYPEGPKDFSELIGLKILDAFVSESLRLYPPVVETRRLVSVKGGVDLPTSPPVHLSEGSFITIPTFVVQRDPDYWPEPEKFDISRFYPENRDKIKSGSYLPFGIGPRNCVGMRFALMTVKMCIAKLLIKYRVLPGPDSKQYPPKFNRHAFFLQLKNTDFRLDQR